MGTTFRGVATELRSIDFARIAPRAPPVGPHCYHYIQQDPPTPSTVVCRRMGLFTNDGAGTLGELTSDDIVRMTWGGKSLISQYPD